MRRFLLLFLLMVVLRPATAQENASLDQFSVYEVNDQAYLYWIVTAGSYCNGIGIERSVDGIAFEEIYDIAGVCGGVSFPQAYNYTDEQPLFNATSYYRLRLGNAGYSEARSILIRNFNGKEYQVIPQPADAGAQIYFDNPRSENITISVYDNLGKLHATFETRSEMYDANVSQLASGIYFLKIEGPQKNIVGRLIVSH